MAQDDTAERGFYFNVETGAVEQGMQSSWTRRMGPYATREEAAQALATARRRTEDWDEQDREWNDS
ncbi:hypothetical protein [Litorihabitans aurantiacus]|uniref:SPOR domain-containing protein n=1 Tax=Litorihabitans aurantiacus TaxID=1930061 RepID=A0AA37XE68_9MICO|nr:hypothetical protein [Litorihabitans aurantiacus]GMA31552.1 hypothetical protein GCM10025875_15440 [Litorihabitans aurantiacus]